jgi:peroxiredoxin (alkyl hydroperoxide reductase subunit C)
LTQNTVSLSVSQLSSPALVDDGRASEEDIMTIVGNMAPSIKLDGVIHGEFSTFDLPHMDGKWTILLFYPLDFTFVCPTEIIAFSDAYDRFKEIGVELYGVSIDSQYTHLAWTETDRKKGGVGDIGYPLLADVKKQAAQAYGVLTDGGVALRGLFLIDDEGVVQHATINNLGVGRSVDETLRLVQAFQHTRKSGEVCPANWEPGSDTMKPSPGGLKQYAESHG